MTPILEIHNISKKFLIDHERPSYLSLRDWIAGAFRSKSKPEEFWALKDISFDVMPGDSLGIIGRNGAGKSTLLKILSRITPPTEGHIITRGRIASLLEVGTGFHQELTGRENIFMNGSILGMKRAEIKTKFDEIVDFSGVEKFLDTPLKNYSSGMQLRLAFAVAAHLEPEILIVDEVLAVGDGEFQKKCLAKMEYVASQGRTVLFVSHNLPSLQAICKTGLLLKDGKLEYEGGISEVINQYALSYQFGEKKLIDTLHYFQPHIRVKELIVHGADQNSFSFQGNELLVEATIEFLKETPFELDLHINKDDVHVASFANFVQSDVKIFKTGVYSFQFRIQVPDFRSGRYTIDLFFTEPFTSWFAVSQNSIEMNIINSHHHTFLNSPNLKWGSVLMQGSYHAKPIA